MIVVENSKAHFLAGAASIDITPPLGTIINGDFIARTALNIHDPLYAKAFYFEKNGVQFCIIIIDTCGLSFDFINQVKIKINYATGLLPQHILIAPTHAHSCGSVLEAFLSGVDDAYLNSLYQKIADVVKKAIANKEPACMAYDAFDVPEHIISRRYKMKEGFIPFKPYAAQPDSIITNPVGLEDWIDAPQGLIDPQLTYTAIRSLAGKWIGILANYSLHYVGDFENNTISADYFGIFSKVIEEEINTPGFVAAMTNGTSGNANIWDFLHPDRYPKQPFAQSNIIAKDLAFKIINKLPELVWDDDAGISILYEEIKVKIIKPQKALYNEAKKIVTDTDYSKINYVNKASLKKIYAREIVLLYKEADYCNFPLHCIKMGNIIIGGIPGEVFGGAGLQLKALAKPLHYFSITMANGYAGYIVPEAEINDGGYETWLCRSSKLPADTEITLIKIFKNFFKILIANA